MHGKTVDRSEKDFLPSAGAPGLSRLSAVKLHLKQSFYLYSAPSDTAPCKSTEAEPPIRTADSDKAGPSPLWAAPSLDSSEVTVGVASS
jgi:hypothetical protein